MTGALGQVIQAVLTEGAKATSLLSQRTGKLKELVQPLITAGESAGVNDAGHTKSVFEALTGFKTSLNGQATTETHSFLDGLLAKLNGGNNLDADELKSLSDIADKVSVLPIEDQPAAEPQAKLEAAEHAKTVAQQAQAAAENKLTDAQSSNSEQKTKSESSTPKTIDERAGEVVNNLIALFTGRVSLPNSFLNNGLKFARAIGIKGIPEPKDLTKWVTEKVVNQSGFKKYVVDFINGKELNEVTIDNGDDGFILGFVKNRALGFMKKALVRIKDTNPEELADGLSRGAFLFNSFGLGPAMSAISQLPLPRIIKTTLAWSLPAISRSIESVGEQDQQNRIKAIHKILNPNGVTADAVTAPTAPASK